VRPTRIVFDVCGSTYTHTYMNAVLYARVSTLEQAEKDLSLPAQLQLMRDFARQHEWSVVEEFIEPGVSARTMERPMLKRLLARCRQQPKVDVVLVHKVDRLARDVYGHATIKALLKQHGIRLASVVENVDDTITGQLVENIMASIAEFYSANLGEEVKKGMRVMIQRGEWPHQPPRGYFQSRTEDRRPLCVPDEVVAPAIRRAFELYATGRYSICAIGQELLIRGVTTTAGKPLPLSYVRSMLENPFYAGRFRWKGAEYPAKHTPLIPEVLFLRVQQTLRHRFKDPGERGRLRFLLRGVAICGDCGYRMTAERHGKWSYYRCIQHAHGRCQAGMSNVTTAHERLVAVYRQLHLPDALKRAIRDAAAVESQRRCAGANRAEQVLHRRRARLLEREVKATEAFAAGDTSREAYRTIGLKIRTETSAVDVALKEARVSEGELMTKVDRVLSFAGSLGDVHGSLDLHRQQRLLSIVFRQITLDRGEIVDYALNQPFDELLRRNSRSDGPPPNLPLSDLEQPSTTRAIKLLFEFNTEGIDALLSAKVAEAA